MHWFFRYIRKFIFYAKEKHVQKNMSNYVPPCIFSNIYNKKNKLTFWHLYIYDVGKNSVFVCINKRSILRYVPVLFRLYLFKLTYIFGFFEDVFFFGKMRKKYTSFEGVWCFFRKMRVEYFFLEKRVKNGFAKIHKWRFWHSFNAMLCLGLEKAMQQSQHILQQKWTILIFYYL